MSDHDSQREARDAGTFAALALLALVAGLLLLMAALVVPQILGLVLVIGLFGGLFVCHYLVWGWWLRKALQASEQEADPPDAEIR